MITFAQYLIIIHYYMDVKAIIKEKGMTIEQVASMMDITRVTFTQNLSRNPTLKTLQRIADVLGCSVGEFFRDELKPSVPENGSSIVCPHCGKHIRIKVERE